MAVLVTWAVPVASAEQGILFPPRRHHERQDQETQSVHFYFYVDIIIYSTKINSFWNKFLSSQDKN
jgi:hypothetical protein